MDEILCTFGNGDVIFHEAEKDGTGCVIRNEGKHPIYFNCPVLNEEKGLWKHNDEVLFIGRRFASKQETQPRIKLVENYTLLILSINLSDGGKYICKENGLMVSSYYLCVRGL